MKRTATWTARGAIVVIAFGVAVVAWAAKPVIKAGAAACNMKNIPFAIGNTWTWKSGTQDLVMRVIEVAPGKDFSGKPATVITVEEVYQGRVLRNQLTCTPDKGLIVPLESILFSAEPGGGVGTTFLVTARDNVTFANDAGMADGNGWVEKVEADVTRIDGGGAGAKHPPGKLQLERHVHIDQGDEVVTPLGQWRSTQKVGFELRGRGIIDNEKVEIPIKRPGGYWVVKGLGVVKMDDAFDKTWELVESNLVAK